VTMNSAGLPARAMGLKETHAWRRLRRAVRSPKGTLLLLFVPMVLLALPKAGASEVLPGLFAAAAVAAAIDMVTAKLTRDRWIFPDGAILSALIVAMVLSPIEDWYVVAATATLAITSKHLFRIGPANVFNPAALAIVGASVLFDGVQDWWGALPALGWWGAGAVLAAGLFMADRIHKMPLVLAFLGPYFALFTAASLFGDAGVAEIFRRPDVHAALFFAFFMVDDPPTCPVHFRHQVAFGLITAVACFAFFQLFGWVYFLPAGLLVANAAEGGRRWLAQQRRRRHATGRVSLRAAA